MTFHSHPGYFYQISRYGDNSFESLFHQSLDLKEKEKTLFVYLTPQSPSSTNPLNNARLATALKEADVVVFDTPPQKIPIPVTSLSDILEKNYDETTLSKINQSLSKNRPCS